MELYHTDMVITIQRTVFRIHSRNHISMSDDRARITARMPQEAYDQLRDELSAFSTDTARFQFLVQFYLDYKDMQCRCMPQAHPPAESRAPRAQSREDTSRSDHQSLSTADSDSASDTAGKNTNEPTDNQSDSATGGKEEESAGQS
jgi:hypothetical protein